MERVYFDYHATTPCDPRVVQKMLPYFTEAFGNASNTTHHYGLEARKAVEDARSLVSKTLGCSVQEVLFTSGATEANHLAIYGVAKAYAEQGKRIITAATEHKSVLHTIESLREFGYDVVVLPVNSLGHIDLQELKDEINAETILVSLMFFNNEIGTRHPVEEIGKICKERKVLFHCDMVQALGKEDLSMEKLGIDLATLSAHKFGGPKGVGALFMRKASPRVRLSQFSFGGNQEKGIRSGTLNVTGIVGLGEACRILLEEGKEERKRIFELREHLLRRIQSEIEGVEVNGDLAKRSPANLHVSFHGINSHHLMESVPEIALSAGSACSATSFIPSHVMKAIGASTERALGALRFGIGRNTTREEIEFTVQKLRVEIERLRKSNTGL